MTMGFCMVPKTSILAPLKLSFSLVFFITVTGAETRPDLEAYAIPPTPSFIWATAWGGLQRTCVSLSARWYHDINWGRTGDSRGPLSNIIVPASDMFLFVRIGLIHAERWWFFFFAHGTAPRMCSSGGSAFLLLRSRLCTREHRRVSNTRGVQHWSGHNIELKDMLNFGAVVLCWKYATFRRSCDNLQLFQPWSRALFPFE